MAARQCSPAADSFTSASPESSVGPVTATGGPLTHEEVSGVGRG